jgi:hypothetical protein
MWGRILRNCPTGWGDVFKGLGRYYYIKGKLLEIHDCDCRYSGKAEAILEFFKEAK